MQKTILMIMAVALVGCAMPENAPTVKRQQFNENYQMQIEYAEKLTPMVTELTEKNREQVYDKSVGPSNFLSDWAHWGWLRKNGQYNTMLLYSDWHDEQLWKKIQRLEARIRLLESQNQKTE